MLRVSQLLIAGLTAISAPASMAECFYPQEVSIPDGTASTYEEMRDSQAFIKEYMAEMETYLICLEAENPEEGNPAQASDQTSASETPHIRKRHAAIDAMESVAARFNEQVRAYKKVNP